MRRKPLYNVWQIIFFGGMASASICSVSFKGSFIAAIALGIIDTLGKYFVTQAAPYLLYAAVFVLLLWRPQGLMPSKAAG